ncbi:MAG: aldehyde dehydrogenase [Candidatus Kapabacteria bacterium]|nr:aldehyde dehydrogenase [Candidatus Kapabacteria bacterium]
MLHIRNYIGGHYCDPNSGLWIENVNPSTGEVYSLIARSDERDVADAVRAAQEAFPTWSAMPAKGRSEVLLRISAKINDHLEDLALAETNDQGKPLWLSRSVDIPRAVENMAFFATEILHTHTDAHQTDESVINFTVRKPLGVVGCISPWNLPLYLFTWKIAPALAAGNTVVAKPSELTPMTAFLLAQICIDAGLPPGVLNIVHGFGPECGQAIVEHPHVKAISFTGGTVTGKAIAAAAAPMFKKLSLELGGKNPTIVFDDVKIASTARSVARAAFTNQGEICLCGSRIFVQRGIIEEFQKALIEETHRFLVGDPLEPETRTGAVVNAAHMEKVLGYIELAKQEGGMILAGGRRVELEGRCAGGFFIEPTLIGGLPQDCRVNREEIFGPAATIIPFDTEDDVVAMANDTAYGLAATIWTTNVHRAHRTAQRLESGIVWVNTWLMRDLRTPFGGMKHSGVGREGGTEALRFFTEPKNICLQIEP